MKTSDAQGPGVDAWLLQRLHRWGIEWLTDVQQRALAAGAAAGHSLVVSAPTSSGKTLVGEIAVLCALRAGVRAIYLVSHKALADQKYLDFVARFGEGAADPIGSVGLNTGDRAEGDVDAQLMVATYEKALGLFLSGQLRPNNALVVADELQILGEPGRGPDIEALCSALRQRGIKQFVALTATVENPDDIAGWMSCDLVRSTHRDVPLYQEIWFAGRAQRTKFGDDSGQDVSGGAAATNDIGTVVDHLLRLDRGPVLVFTESRREAVNFATAFGQSRPRVEIGIDLAQRLDLFSEPTESSDQLRENAERRVAFHTADLSPQERQVIEGGFTDGKFEVCFATSTLAAGVNFPFRTIVFSKLTYRWGDRAGSHIVRSDYRNMSGRAGRLGMHPEGFAVLLPQNNVELAHANILVLPDNDRLNSQLVNLSIRKTILTLVASGLASSLAEVMAFFENTLYWYQTLNRNPAKLATLTAESRTAVHWLAANGLIREQADALLITPMGNAAAMSGLLPATAVQLAAMLRAIGPTLAGSFDEWIPGLIYACCASEEFRAERPSRFFPFPSQTSYESVTFWGTKPLPVELDRNDVKLAQCAHAIALYAEGLADRKIAYIVRVPGAAIHRLALDVAWVLDGLHKLSTTPELGCPQPVSNQIAMLARRVRWGAPPEALDVLRVAERHSVPGFGRQRAMGLVAQGIASLHDILAMAKDKLVQLLRSEPRAQALIDAVSSTVGLGPSRLASAHRKTGLELGIEHLVKACDDTLGTEYEEAIATLLRVEAAWAVTVLDDGMRQNVPDLLIVLGTQQVLLECKTCSKSPPLIKKEEAWAVMQKAADFDSSMRRVTLGKPTFDETSKKKAAASKDITLIEHGAFMEGLLRVHGGTLAAADFMIWLGNPGVAELERLGGNPTYVGK
ncbi:extensin [Acidovorax sp. SUPP1855]|uniref:DEAD/DEAH box helicase n=1 Tax=Acidovorax sp. SUPP1855 TaxID=431774 RepID=UPI0023DE2B54|nr:DEAD/DEAH box helicase [Acidovorax sp. SUPP1855]GKS87254.1 extensin [Acidovorax sp. SUPP1855]